MAADKGHGMNRWRGAWPLAFVAAVTSASVGLSTPARAQAACTFVLGFATLRDLIGGQTVGDCLEDQHSADNGDAQQQTTGGLLVWRKADNWTAFTDGYRTWINGPYGLQQRLNTERFAWEADATVPSRSAATQPDLVQAAEQVRACMSFHGLPTAHAVLRFDADSMSPITVFGFCDWPPPPYAAQDGYSQIRVQSVAGPGQSEASGANVADRIVADCPQAALSYSFGSQGAYSHDPPFIAISDSVVTVDGARWTGPRNTLPFYPRRGEIVVLRNDKHALDAAECVPTTPPQP